MLIGADPEFFIVDNKFQIINAFRLIKKNKKNPLKIKDFKFFYDNVAIEANFSPVNTKEQFVAKIDNMFLELRKITSPYNLSLQAYGELNEIETKFPNTNEIGCEPDLNAYKFCYNKLPIKQVRENSGRTIGGHLHIGGLGEDAVLDPFMKPLFVYMLDLFVGIPSVLIDTSVDSYKRRKIFGKAGSYKSKKYGLEYRVLSPFWLSNPSLAELIYRLVEFVFNGMNEKIYTKFWQFDETKMGSKTKDAYKCFGYDCDEVSNCINNMDINLAKKYYNFIHNFLPEDIAHLLDQEIEKKCNPVDFYWNT
jgi:hypothetical protein